MPQPFHSWGMKRDKKGSYTLTLSPQTNQLIKIIFTWRLQQVLQLSFNICIDKARTCLFCSVNCIACLVSWTPTFPACVNIWIVRENSIALFAVMYFWCKVCIEKSPKFFIIKFPKDLHSGNAFCIVQRTSFEEEAEKLFLKKHDNKHISTFRSSLSLSWSLSSSLLEDSELEKSLSEKSLSEKSLSEKSLSNSELLGVSVDMSASLWSQDVFAPWRFWCGNFGLSQCKSSLVCMSEM